MSVGEGKPRPGRLAEAAMRALQVEGPYLRSIPERRAVLALRHRRVVLLVAGDVDAALCRGRVEVDVDAGCVRGCGE